MKRLIVTADDVGLDRGMTSGAIEAHRNGIVTACSLVANGLEFDDAVARLREVPSLEVGVHLALVEERALTTGKPMPKIEPTLASCTVVSTPSARQRAVSTDCRYSSRSCRSRMFQAMPGRSKSSFSRGQRYFFAPGSPGYS